MAGKLQLPGKVVGIDLWKSADQSSNSLTATQQNIEAAGVSNVAEIKTADMTKLPFDDESFDYVFASLAIHNVKPRAQRELALREALRVLKPAGYLVIIDLEYVGEFKRYLNEQNCRQVSVKRAEFNGLWGWLAADPDPGCWEVGGDTGAGRLWRSVNIIKKLREWDKHHQPADQLIGGVRLSALLQ